MRISLVNLIESREDKALLSEGEWNGEDGFRINSKPSGLLNTSISYRVQGPQRVPQNTAIFPAFASERLRYSEWRRDP